MMLAGGSTVSSDLNDGNVDDGYDDGFEGDDPNEGEGDGYGGDPNEGEDPGGEEDPCDSTSPAFNEDECYAIGGEPY